MKKLILVYQIQEHLVMHMIVKGKMDLVIEKHQYQHKMIFQQLMFYNKHQVQNVHHPLNQQVVLMYQLLVINKMLKLLEKNNPNQPFIFILAYRLYTSINLLSFLFLLASDHRTVLHDIAIFFFEVVQLDCFFLPVFNK